MQEPIPYNKIFRLALITAPLFGLFGATPALVMGYVELARVLTGFFLVTGFTLVFWAINTGLVWAGERAPLVRHNWVRYLLSAVSSGIFMTTVFFVVVTNGWMPNHVPGLDAVRIKTGGVFVFPLIQAQSINIIIIVLLEMVLLRNRKEQVENENNLLRVANLEARHSQLQQQLHPHFLFNSLSVLRSLIKRSPDEAETYLEKLSELLRFSITGNQQALVPLHEELELCTNYLHMQRVRFANALQVQIEIPDTLRQTGKVPVYSIQLLVENAIKHNALTQSNPLRIQITGSDAAPMQTITVSNNLQPRLTKEASTGVGLANLGERYKLLNGSDIRIRQADDIFSVTLQVLDYENSDY